MAWNPFDRRSTEQITESECAVIAKILEQGDVHEARILAAQLEGALVARTTYWVLDIDVPGGSRAARSVPDGPLSVQALVPNDADYRGEILVWVKNGLITGLEYAYVTEEIPDALPPLDEIQVRPTQTG